MKSPSRPIRSGRLVASVVGAVVVLAGLVAVQVASATTAREAAPATAASAKSSAAAHSCLVMTGSGDTAFTRNFNPYTSSTINGGFVKGAIYGPLIVATAAGG